MNHLLIQVKIPLGKITKTITAISTINKKALEELNENILELMNDKGLIAP